jgi:hypothetical protein
MIRVVFARGRVAGYSVGRFHPIHNKHLRRELGHIVKQLLDLPSLTRSEAMHDQRAHNSSTAINGINAEAYASAPHLRSAGVASDSANRRPTARAVS